MQSCCSCGWLAGSWCVPAAVGRDLCRRGSAAGARCRPDCARSRRRPWTASGRTRSGWQPLDETVLRRLRSIRDVLAGESTATSAERPSARCQNCAILTPPASRHARNGKMMGFGQYNTADVQGRVHLWVVAANDWQTQLSEHVAMSPRWTVLTCLLLEPDSTRPAEFLRRSSYCPQHTANTPALRAFASISCEQFRESWRPTSSLRVTCQAVKYQLHDVPYVLYGQ